MLWSLLLTTLLVLTFLTASRTSIRITSNTLDHAEATALAEAGVSIAILDLIDAFRHPGAPRRIPVDGNAVTCRLAAGVRLTLVIEDEAGKIDLNRANDVLLRFLLTGIGLSPAEASGLADRILDYRDPDEIRRLNGAERDDYRRQGRKLGPSDSPFLTTDELTRVLGTSERTVERLMPLVTVDSGLSGLDLDVAPQQLIDTLNRGLTNAGDALVSTSTATRAIPPLPPVYRIVSPGTVFHIRAVARLENGSVAETSAIVEMSRTLTRQFSIRRWLGSTHSGASRRSREPRDIGPC